MLKPVANLMVEERTSSINKKNISHKLSLRMLHNFGLCLRSITPNVTFEVFLKCHFEPRYIYYLFSINVPDESRLVRDIARHFACVLDNVFCKLNVSVVIVLLFNYLLFMFITYIALLWDPYYIACSTVYHEYAFF